MFLSPLFGEILHLPDVLGSYRVHGDNLSDVGQVSLAKVRRDLGVERRRDRAIRECAARHEVYVASTFLTQNSNYCKKRLVSLRIDPAEHEFPEDRTLYLVGAGMVASFRSPHVSLAKRLLGVTGFLALGLIPSSVVARNLEALMHPRARFSMIRHLSKLARALMLQEADRSAVD